jgi:glycogen operon protein
MTDEDWNSTETRIIQRLNEHLDQDGNQNLTLLVINGSEDSTEVTLPVWETVQGYELLWNSADELPKPGSLKLNPGDNVAISECSVALFRATGK